MTIKRIYVIPRIDRYRFIIIYNLFIAKNAESTGDEAAS